MTCSLIYFFTVSLLSPNLIIAINTTFQVSSVWYMAPDMFLIVTGQMSAKANNVLTVDLEVNGNIQKHQLLTK